MKVTRREALQAGAGIVPLPTPVNTDPRIRRVLMGTPTLGAIRMEWHNAMAGLIIPCNWSMASMTPMNYLVADGQNLVVYEALKQGFEWVVLLEDDVIPPLSFLLRLAEHINRKPAVPIVSGVYNLKGSDPREPLMYRGRGTGPFKEWKAGDQVWVDGVPTGCLLVHTSIFVELAKIRPVYPLVSSGGALRLPQYFETPRKAFVDAKSGAYMKLVGTSDLYFCDMVMQNDILRKAGWKHVARREFPFLVDTRIACGHIDRDTGVLW